MKKNLILFPALFFLLASCGSEPPPAEQEVQAVVEESPASELATFKFSYSIANLPPPMKIVDEFSKSDLPVNVSLLNPVSNASNYHTSLKQAFNYGIYGVDLAYVIFNERTPEILKYYPLVKSLAGQLDMAETFNQYVNRFENNSENRDSLRRITDEVYTATDAFLRSNERLTTASLIMAGSWLECQHIVVNLLLSAEQNDKNAVLYRRVWEQRLYLDNISKLLEEFLDEPKLEDIKIGFDALLEMYMEAQEVEDVDQKHLGKLAKGIAKVRDKVIN